MVEQTWEKPKQADVLKPSSKVEQYKFLVAGGLMLAAVVFLIIFSTQSGAQYFITVDDLVTSSDYIGQSSRISGAVVGDIYECNDGDDDASNDCSTCDVSNGICYDTQNIVIEFTIAHIPQETGDLERTLYDAVRAVKDPETDINTLVVHYEGVKPDLLQNEAQAILTGELGEDGKFYASELLLKCPSRYGEEVPDQTTGNEGT